MNQQHTVVLPMYNCERNLRLTVIEVLDLAQSIGKMIEIVIVDDGSTDETFETACEMSRAYPQVQVLRQAVRKGLDAAMELVGRRLAVEMVVAHDGTTPVDTAQLKMLLQLSPSNEAKGQKQSMWEAAGDSSVGSRRFASVRALQKSMEQAHRRVTGFRWMQIERPMVPRRRVSSVQTMPAVALDGPAIVASGILPTL